MKKIYVFSMLFVVLLLSGCSLISSIDLKEYQTYVENKYGSEKEFYMVRTGMCNWFELGYCT